MKKDKFKLIEKDVGMVEDLIFGLKNLCAIEEHCINSYDMSKDLLFMEILEEVRRIRTKYLSILTKEDNFQGWCISKHLLCSAMSIHEVGTRFLSTDQKNKADLCFKDSSDLIKIFMILNGIEDGEIKSGA